MVQQKIMVGGLSPRGENILNKYLEKFLPDAEKLLLQPAGVRGRVKTQGKRADVALIILPSEMYEKCEGVCDAVLKLEKCHRYENDDDLEEFLAKMFGRIEIDSSSSDDTEFERVEQGTSEGGLDGKNLVEEYPFEGIDIDFGSEETMIEPSIEDTDSSTGVIGGSLPSSDEVDRLKNEIEEQKKVIQSLTAQLDGSEVAGDITAMAKSIRDLREELSEKDNTISKLEDENYKNLGKITKANAVFDEIKTLKSDKIKLSDSVSDLTYEKTKLTEEVSNLNSKVNQLEGVKSELESLKVALSTAESELTTTNVKYQSKCDEYDTLKTKYDSLEGSLTKSHDKVSDLESKLDALSTEKEELANKLNDLVTKVSELQKQVKTKEVELQSYKELLKEKEDDIHKLEGKVFDLQQQVHNKDMRINSLNESVQTLEDNVTKVKSDLEAAETAKTSEADALSKLQEEYNNLQSSMKDDLSKQMSEKDTRIKEVEESLELANSKLREKDIELSELRDKVSEGESAKFEYTALVESSENKQKELRDEITRLQGVVSTSEGRITELEEKLETAQLENDTSELDETITELGRKNQSLESQITELKSQVADTGKTEELRFEIASLRKELETAKSKNMELQKRASNTNIDDMRKRITSLELERADLQEELDDLSSSLFVGLQNSALPKVKLNSVIELPNIKSHVIAMSSSSTLSNMTAYQSIRMACEKYKNKHIMLIDLTNDSYIDSEFKTKGVTTPIEWLSGKAPLRNFVVDTAYSNVKVTSTGLSYFNPLYLLEVDWNKRLKELEGIADVIILYFGCLNDVVCKVLFQSFARVVDSYTIVNATPINIRTTILTLAGMKNVSNVRVYCANFDKASKVMYEKLSSKYTSIIITDNDTVEL